MCQSTWYLYSLTAIRCTVEPIVQLVGEVHSVGVSGQAHHHLGLRSSQLQVEVDGVVDIELVAWVEGTLFSPGIEWGDVPGVPADTIEGIPIVLS